MEYRKVGTSGLAVSRMGLGTMTWGRDTSKEEAKKLVKAFVSEGGNLIDTAPAYGAGFAESVIGRLIHTEVSRNDLVIATKAGFGTHGKKTIDTSRSAMLDDLANSLRRLHTDHVDIWQIHTWGSAPIEETLSALDHAVNSGMARYVGVSNFIGWQTGTAASWQKAIPSAANLISNQVEYSLLARRAEIEAIPAAQHHNMGIFAWSPIGRGVLSGKYLKSIPAGSRAARDQMRWFVEPYLETRSTTVVEAVNRAATGLGITPAQVSYLWVRDAPGICAPLLGARTVEQLLPYFEAEEMSLPNQIVSALDDVTGGANILRPENKPSPDF